MNRVVKVVIAVTGAAMIAFHAVASAQLGPIPRLSRIDKKTEKAEVPFKIDELKDNWRERIETIRKAGKLPIIDIESSYKTKAFKPKRFAKEMDKYGVALIAFSPQIGKKKYKKKGKVWISHVRKLIFVDPWRYIPVTTAGGAPAWTQSPEEFLEAQIDNAGEDEYPLMGEFEFRHYPSPRQYKRGAMHRDVTIPINGELGNRLFAFSQETRIPFQLHYEIEDPLLPSLEEMLTKYPGAIVIWAHLAQIRYQKRSTVYGPAYVRKLIKTYPNLYFDTAFGHASSTYPGSGEYQARIWDREKGGIKSEWKQLISDYPWRFLAAFDLGGDRMNQLPNRVRKVRRFLDTLPPQAREIVAYKAAWKLLFNEEL